MIVNLNFILLAANVLGMSSGSHDLAGFVDLPAFWQVGFYFIFHFSCRTMSRVNGHTRC
jgi:hypothetical protein